MWGPVSLCRLRITLSYLLVTRRYRPLQIAPPQGSCNGLQQELVRTLHEVLFVFSALSEERGPCPLLQPGAWLRSGAALNSYLN